MRDGIIKRGTTYSYVVRERDPQTGKTKPRWVGGFKTQKEAKAARDKARTDVRKGTWVPPTSLTVSEWLDQWLQGHAVSLKDSTVHAYRQKIDGYLKPTIGGERLQSLSPSRLSVVFRTMSESGGKGGRPLSARSVEFTRSILRKALNDAVAERVLEVNPVAGSKAPRRRGKPKHTTWTGDQQRTFLDARADDRWLPLWQLALATGMRRGELCALTWADVDLDAGIVNVERAATQFGQRWVTDTTKNHERRKVSIDPHTVAILRAWRKRQTAERLAAGPAWVDTDGLLFTWQDGSRVSLDYTTKAFVKVQTGTDLPRMSLHGCRHSHATTLLRAGVPVHIVSKRLGHKDPSVTLDVYADVIPEDDDRAVEVFSKAVWGA